MTSVIRVKQVLPVLVIASALSLGGCSSMSDTERRTATGAGIGAATGAAVGGMAGSWGWGAAAGAALGAGGGYLYDKQKKKEDKEKEDAYQRGYEAGKREGGQ